ncbi:MAG: glycosyltransferase family 9 protein, partial [Tenacibaculum sp.]
MNSKPIHILVIRLSAMGDVAMTIPVIRCLLKQYPSVRISILTRPFFAPFFREFKAINTYCTELEGKHKGFIGLYKLHKDLLNLKFDAVADLHKVLRSNILVTLFRLRGIKCIQIDKGRKEKKQLTAAKIDKALYPLKSTHKRYADVFKKLGYAVNLNKPYSLDKPKLTNNFVNKFKKNRIGIAPFASYKSKSLPVLLIKKLISQLSLNPKNSILLFGGGKGERVILEKLSKDYSNVHSLVQKFSFEEELDI